MIYVYDIFSLRQKGREGEGWKEERKAGRKAGRKEGRREGRKEGGREGRREGRKEGRKERVLLYFVIGFLIDL